MRVFIAVLILILNLQSWTKADDIRDFEIEGMSIGDSLLDHYEKSVIDAMRKTMYPKNNKFYQLETQRFESANYDSFSFHLKNYDDKYIIYEVSGIKYFENDIQGCNNYKENIVQDLNSIFPNVEKNIYDYKYFAVDDGKSIAKITDFYLSDGSIRVYCVNWSEITEEKRNFADNVSVSINTKKILEWISTGY